MEPIGMRTRGLRIENIVFQDQDIEGFMEVSVKRGFTEIQPIYEAIHPFNAFICGGYVRFMSSPHPNPAPAGDVDIYSNDEGVYTDLVEVFKNINHLRIKHQNDVSMTFKQPSTGKFKYCPIIQLIKPANQGAMVVTGNMDEILSNFDFSVVRCGLISETKAKVDKNFNEDEKNKRLRLKNIHCPVSSILRCMKYSRKGYYLKPTESLKLFLDWESRDADYKSKVKDYLTKANGGDGLSQVEVEELEALMRID